MRRIFNIFIGDGLLGGRTKTTLGLMVEARYVNFEEWLDWLEKGGWKLEIELEKSSDYFAGVFKKSGEDK